MRKLSKGSSYASLKKEICKKRANKIISVLSSRLNLKKCRVLDIGTGSGYIAFNLSKVCGEVISVDVSDQRETKEGYKFFKLNHERLPFKSQSFDVIISNHVIEHVVDQKLHLSEANRVLKKNGVFYLSTPNKYWPIEPHFKFPFLSYFPFFISNYISRAFYGREFDVNLLSYKKLVKLVLMYFEFENLTIEILKNPDKYNLEVYKPLQPFFAIMPLFLLRSLNPIYPTYILLLKK